MKNISFRLSEEDFAAIEAAAAHEFLSVASFLRKLALEHARKLGVLKQQTANNPMTQNQTPLTAPMRDGVHSREALLKRIESGEQLRDVAVSVGVQVSELQARVAKAKAARVDGSLDKALALEKFLRDTPKPDDEKDYVPAYFDGVYEWKEHRPAFNLPTPVDEALARAPHEHSDDPEVNAARARAKLLAMGFNV